MHTIYQRGPDMAAALRFYGGRLWAAWVYPDHVHTILYDGSQTRGYPPASASFLGSSRDLGYGDDVFWHMIEHDLIHSMLTERLDNAPSAALWNQAHDQRAYLKRMPLSVQEDEARVGAAQAAINDHDWGRARLNEILGLDTAGDIVRKLITGLRPGGVAMTSEWARTTKPQIILPKGWVQASEFESAQLS